MSDDAAKYAKWNSEAEKQTTATIGAFIERIINDENHTYDSIIHATAACAIAGAAASQEVDPRQGLSGFQAGFVPLMFLREWSGLGDAPIKITSYDNLLFPQYRSHFDKILDADTCEWLQKEAQGKLDKTRLVARLPDPEVYKHWEKLAAGELPFGFRRKE